MRQEQVKQQEAELQKYPMDSLPLVLELTEKRAARQKDRILQLLVQGRRLFLLPKQQRYPSADPNRSWGPLRLPGPQVHHLLEARGQVPLLRTCHSSQEDHRRQMKQLAQARQQRASSCHQTHLRLVAVA